MTHDTQIVLPFASLCGKQLQVDFNGGTVTSDGGVLLLREIEAQVGIIGRFVAALNDPRDPRYIDHSYEDLLRQRIFQISCGYEDANDCNTLRSDPALKVACDRLPIVGKDLASQPTMSRAENAPRRSELYRMGKALFDTFLASYDRPPKAILLDIDDTEDEVHGAQQQALFNGYYDAYCSLPLHIYEGQSGKFITSILRPGRRPSGAEIVSILKRVVGAIRREWPAVSILLRGDGHFSTPEVHQWCESQEPVVVYILGQSGNAVLKRHQKRREAPAFMPGMDRRWARRAQCPRAQQDLRSTRALNGRGHCIGGSPGIHAGEDVPHRPDLPNCAPAGPGCSLRGPGRCGRLLGAPQPLPGRFPLRYGSGDVPGLRNGAVSV